MNCYQLKSVAKDLILERFFVRYPDDFVPMLTMKAFSLVQFNIFFSTLSQQFCTVVNRLFIKKKSVLNLYYFTYSVLGKEIKLYLILSTSILVKYYSIKII